MGHGIKNPPAGAVPLGRNHIHLTRGERDSLKAILRSPNRVSLLHKGGNSLYGAAGAEVLSRISKYPSSATQLPILAALHAGLPTLFATNIHDNRQNVKTQMEIFSKTGTPPDFSGGGRIREPLNNSARAGGEGFWLSRKYLNCGNTLCIFQFWYCTDGAKDPPSSCRRIVQRFPRAASSALPYRPGRWHRFGRR